MEERKTSPILRVMNENINIIKDKFDAIGVKKSSVIKSVTDEYINPVSIEKAFNITSIASMIILILFGISYKYNNVTVELLYFFLSIIAGNIQLISMPTYHKEISLFKDGVGDLSSPGVALLNDLGNIGGKFNLANGLLIKFIGYLDNALKSKDPDKYWPEAFRKLFKIFYHVETQPTDVNIQQVKTEISNMFSASANGPLSIDFDGQPLTINIAGKDGPISLTVANVVSLARGKSRRGHRKKRQNKSRRRYKRK